MPRRRFKIPPDKKEETIETQEEKVEDLLASLDSIQSKKSTRSDISPSSFPKKGLIGGIAIIVVIALAFLTFADLSLPNTNDDGTSPIEGTINDSLDFKIQLLDENEVMLSDFAGNPIILDLMATWCVPCKTQITYLKIIQERYTNVQIISISVDSNDNINTLSSYKAEHGMTWTVGRDITKKGAEIYSATYIPTLAFINSAGVLKQWNQGVVNTETLTSWIEED